MHPSTTRMLTLSEKFKWPHSCNTNCQLGQSVCIPFTVYVIQSTRFVCMQAGRVVQWLAHWTCEPMVPGSVSSRTMSNGLFHPLAHSLCWQPVLIRLIMLIGP